MWGKMRCTRALEETALAEAASFLAERALAEAVIKRLPNFVLHCTATIKDSKNLLNQINANLIIIDLNLPDGSGEGLVNYIKSHQTLKHLPIIILSADAMPETIKRLNKVGIDSYITKPLNIAEFSHTILKLTQDNWSDDDRQ